MKGHLPSGFQGDGAVNSRLIDALVGCTRKTAARVSAACIRVGGNASGRELGLCSSL